MWTLPSRHEGYSGTTASSRARPSRKGIGSEKDGAAASYSSVREGHGQCQQQEASQESKRRPAGSSRWPAEAGAVSVVGRLYEEVRCRPGSVLTARQPTENHLLLLLRHAHRANLCCGTVDGTRRSSRHTDIRRRAVCLHTELSLPTGSVANFLAHFPRRTGGGRPMT